MSAIIPAVSASGYRGIGFLDIHPPSRVDLHETYTDEPGKDLQRLSRA
jgi:hypothetical protein